MNLINSNPSFGKLNKYNEEDIPQYEDIKIGQGKQQKYQKPLQINYDQVNKHHHQSAQQLKNKKELNIVQNIRTIFMFYVQFGNKINILHLKSNKFLKLFQDCNLIGPKLSTKDLDIMYYQETRNTETLSFNQFLDLLLKIAIKLYQQSNQSLSFQLLYKSNLEDLYHKISQSTEFGQDLQLIEQYRTIIAQKYQNYIATLQGVLQKIHAFIFHDQSQKITQIQSQYMHFLSSFEIIPLIITQTKGQLIFFYLIHNDSTLQIKQNGNYLFSLAKFIESLLLIYQFQKIYDCSDLDDPNQFIIFLEKLETSKGFENFSKSHYQTKNEQTQLVMAISRINSAKQSRVVNINQNIQSTSQIQQQQSSLQEEIPAIPYEKELKNIFEYYSQIGEPLNLINLKSIKYKKLLQQAGIIGNVITQVDADMIYVQATPKKRLDLIKSPKFKVNKLYDSDSQNGKLDFPNFLYSLEIIAQKFLQNNFIQLVETYLIPLENQLRIEKQEQILQILMILLDDPNIVQLYEIMQQHFDPYYYHYTNNQMNISGFMKFCQDFELANSIVSKSQLMHVFKALATLNNNETIDKHQFVEAISVIAVLVYGNIQDNSQKIIYLLERITQSDGAIKVSKQLGIVRNPQKSNLLQLFRYQTAKDVIQKEQVNFNDIVGELEHNL